MEKLNDKWFRLIGIPLCALIVNVLFYYDMNQRHGFPFWVDYLNTLIIAGLIWESNRAIILYTRRRFTSYKESGNRILYTFIGISIATIFVSAMSSLFYDLTLFWGYKYSFKNYLYNAFTALTYTMIIGAMYEGSYYFRKWNRVELQAEILKRENLQSQYESLKQQLNPHFLFNSLNTLSSLITSNSEKAEDFLNEMSKVYRYLLSSNELQLTTLETELKFADSYFHLLKTRYDEGLQMSVNIDPVYLKYYLPPLTLQILIENAAKHNIIDKSKKLCISLDSNQSGCITVKNNIQRKIIKMPSNKVGLANIVKKYELLGHSDIIIEHSEEFFEVQLPLLKNNEYDLSNSRR